MKVSAHAVIYHAGKAWLCICVGVEPPFSKSWIRYCSPTLTTTSCQSITALSIPSTFPPPLNSTRLIISMSAAMSTIPSPAVTSEVSFQPELQPQLTSLMNRLIQQAIAAVVSQIMHTTPNPLPALLWTRLPHVKSS